VLSCRQVVREGYSKPCCRTNWLCPSTARYSGRFTGALSRIYSRWVFLEKGDSS
jgi:hypothetical protein